MPDNDTTTAARAGSSAAARGGGNRADPRFSVGSSETTPLLWASSSSVADSGALAPPIEEAANNSGGFAVLGSVAAWRDRLAQPSVWKAVTAAAVVMFAVFLTAWICLYNLYIPMRLQKGSGESGTVVTSFHLMDIQESVVLFNMTGLQHVGDPSPVDVIVNPSSFELVPLSDAIYPPRGTAQAGKFPPRIPASWEDEDDYMRNERPDAVLPGAAVARLASPGLHIPPGVEWAPLTMESGTRLDLIRQGYIADLLSAALGQNASQEGGPLASAFTLRQQSKPVIAIPGVGRWTIPIWSYYYLNFTALPSTNSTGSGFNTSAFNVTVESQVLEYDTVTLPSGEEVTVYVANVSLSFTNPFDGATQDANGTLLPKVTLDDLGLGITFSIFHEGVRMARATVDLPAVLAGRNVGTLAVHGRSDPYGTETLMEWFGKYADGEDTLIVLDEFAIAYRGGRARLGWVERMVSRWRFGVVIPGAEEEEEDETGRSFSAPQASVVEVEVAFSRMPLRSLLGSVVGF
ncbi:hypothetical protein HK405_009368 [Cladochytrium tenue]|nr:hypothetical protein HK405_009368 [Cladochytrium tenue]